MTLYWLLFAVAAVIALAAPFGTQGARPGAAQTLAMLLFIVGYVALAGLRYRIGGDWDAYEEMYDAVRQDTLWEAANFTDPLFGFLLWLSARLGFGMYLPNAICAGLMIYGVVRLAATTRDPWLAIVAAVPYMLIVVGMGYVRQAGAIGLLMTAAAVADRAHWSSVVARIGLASGLHATASVTFPLFGRLLSRTSRLLGLVASLIGGLAFLVILYGRLGLYESGYLDQEYDSGGATVRLLISLLPSLLLLLRHRHYQGGQTSREIWLGCAVVNVVAMFALLLSPSSTAVDRMALYFSPVQLIVYGNLADLLPTSRAGAYVQRFVAIALAAGVQAVWLVFATHADLWVPYRSILELV